ncbi:EamA/RhaT family transporter [Roseobacter denitrificans]|uniref:Membrane protein, putative n=1 Tax=Roseobacter denitrificans (strain ATCC 33942 / OCh 114) TaxID=375451 RepID=Q160B9_ROSDO|nr:DMT family transporter [Roseobacter denitrificans]ABG33674.1 membrane protein, putative [Roseobacter denitrificans OCh 114]AVL52964.1 EamA/RhaT family transporter [Roseobacter denitrificans]SFG02861.1 EamA-like transporter family protein [Roseobacter denitrificans OCh 114]
MTALYLGLVAAFCWGLHDIAIRYLSRSVPLMGALLVVLTTGLIFQSLVIVVNQAPFLPQGPALWSAIGAGVAFLVASLGLYFAFQRGPVRLVSPIIGAFPVLSLIYAALAGTPITFDQIAAVLLIVAAVGLVAILSDSEDTDIPPKGPTIIYSLLSAVGFATTFKLGQISADLGGEWPGTFTARVVALVLLVTIIMAFKSNIRVGWRAVPPLIVMGLLDGIALLAVFSAGAFDRPEYASVAASMFGLFTILLARVFLKELMGPAQWAGCVVAFFGIGYLSF